MLELKGIYKTFNAGTVNEKRAIDNLNLTLENGDFVTIIGGNGAGKSTTLNLIAGVFPVDAGTINLNGFNLTHLPEHKRAKYLGRVFQDPMMGTAATMGIEENLALAYRRGQRRGLHAGITNEERKLYREKLATLGLGLEDRMTSKVGLLSGGQRQALTLLMATLRKPDLLLLDEHTAALDPKTADKVLQITEEIVARDNLTTMMVTHNMKHAIQYGNRLIMMDSGRVVVDIRGEEKKHLTGRDLLEKVNIEYDRLLLSEYPRSSKGDAVPLRFSKSSEETFGDNPLAPAQQGRLGTQGELPRRGKRRCPGVRVPRQWGKSPAELDFYGEFYAALCGAPVLPVLPKAKSDRRLRPLGAKKARRRRAFSVLLPYNTCDMMMAQSMMGILNAIKVGMQVSRI